MSRPSAGMRARTASLHVGNHRLFDGVAYGMLLFLISIGLSVTLGLMNFVNLAHGAFAMLGGYVCVRADDARRAAVPRRRCRSPSSRRRSPARCSSARSTAASTGAAHLDQVLFTIGLVFMAVAAATYLFGPRSSRCSLPACLRGQVRSARHRPRRLPAVPDRGRASAITAALHLAGRAHALRRAGARGGRQPRSRGRRSASTSSRVFSLTFALGSGLAGLGGALGDRRAGARPVVSAQVPGVLPARRRGRRRAARSTGRWSPRCCSASSTSPANTTCRRSARFVIYALMVVLLVLFPHGLLRQARVSDARRVAARASRRPDRWHPPELAFWLAPVVGFFVLPDHRAAGSQILDHGLFALSLDLVLGYAGIVSLGHAAFFGLGAYTAGLLAQHGWGEPLSRLLAAGAVARRSSGFVVELSGRARRRSRRG